MRRTQAVVSVIDALNYFLDAPHGLLIARHSSLPPGTVYRVLERMRDEGWVTARKAGRRTRYYLTPLGKSWANAWTRPTGEVAMCVRRRSDDVWVIRWLGDNWPAVEAFCGSEVRRDGDVLWLRTVDGNEESAQLGWWIVAGVHNKYPIPQSVFDATYQLP